MASINKKRLTVEMEGDFVVFLIGARFNNFWKLPKHRWVLRAMTAMLKELANEPEMGLLHYRQHFSLRNAMVIQCWRSWEDLERYSRNRDAERFPNWVKFNKLVGSNGDIGIWHETYRVKAGQYEAVYNNMPGQGLGRAGRLVPAAGYKSSAAGRLAGHQVAGAPVTPEGEVVEVG